MDHKDIFCRFLWWFINLIAIYKFPKPIQTDFFVSSLQESHFVRFLIFSTHSLETFIFFAREEKRKKKTDKKINMEVSTFETWQELRWGKLLASI